MRLRCTRAEKTSAVVFRNERSRNLKRAQSKSQAGAIPQIGRRGRAARGLQMAPPRKDAPQFAANLENIS
jgi:hypothetical protein